MFGINAFDPSNESTQMYMNQSHGMPVPPGGLNYTYNSNLSSPNKQRQNSQASMGMSQTLSQSPFQAGQNNMADVKAERVSSPYGSTPVSASDDYTSQSYGYAFDAFGDSQTGNGTQSTEEYSDLFDADGGAQNVGT